MTSSEHAASSLTKLKFVTLVVGGPAVILSIGLATQGYPPLFLFVLPAVYLTMDRVKKGPIIVTVSLSYVVSFPIVLAAHSSLGWMASGPLICICGLLFAAAYFQLQLKGKLKWFSWRFHTLAFCFALITAAAITPLFPKSTKTDFERDSYRTKSGLDSASSLQPRNEKGSLVGSNRENKAKWQTVLKTFDERIEAIRPTT